MPENTKLLVAPCSHKAAKYAVMNWHYSKCMPCGKAVNLGVWENDKYIGCVIFSRGASPHLLTKYELSQKDGCELTRIALTQHTHPVSRIVSVALKQLKRYCPALKVVISFADPEEGHNGGIYQASNWIYTGETPKTKYYIHKNGGKEHHRSWFPKQKIHHRRVSKTGYVKSFDGRVDKRLKTEEVEPIWCVGKHRYIYPLNKEIRKQIEPLRQPYPKRPVSETVSRPAIQQEVGGATPTTGL